MQLTIKKKQEDQRTWDKQRTKNNKLRTTWGQI